MNETKKGDINCFIYGKYILTGERDCVGGDILIAGGYEGGYYRGEEDVFICKDCAKIKDI